MTTVSIPTLSTRAMLVYVKISVWSARKLDKKQTQKTIKDAGATNDAARVNKHLLANADAKLREVQRVANQIRAYLDANTLPWDDAGNRLLSNDRALIVVGDLHNLHQEFNRAVDEFVQEYPVLRAQALYNLGDMANDEDYPQPDVVRSKFSVRISFNPVPANFGDVRIGMSEEQARAWQRHFETNVQRQVNDALRAAWERLREALARYSDRLQLDTDGKLRVFKNSMVENLRETCALLASLNVFGDPDLEAVTRQVQRDIAAFDADELRHSPAVAMSVKADVDAVLQKMQAFLGD